VRQLKPSRPAQCLAAGAVLGLLASAADAQWISLKSPGVPRAADGKPNLKAPAPRQSGKPDLTGLWRFTAIGYTNNVTTDLKAEEIDPSAGALYKQRQENLFADDPSTFRCLPSGPRLLYGPMDLVRMIQTPSMLVMLYEDLSYRQIFMDGRELPTDPNPSFMGYSVGRWEGDTLVIDSVGFNGTTWLDYGGHPHSEALRMTEHIKRTDFGHLAVEVRIDDPKYYKRAWTVPSKAEFVADTDMIEYLCNENQKDRPHMVGKASDARKFAVNVAPQILATYVGTYAFDPSNTMKIHVTLERGILFMDVGGKDRQELIPLSGSTFTNTAVRMEFTSDRLIFHLLEGDTMAMKEK
jgi:hypothetical protein